ncbi:outer membrane protein with beta-barrel domain [Algoriphagus boseongensis]|uniref:Outer membrane protein with beta-barrel domain n=1 Tax=Algoriphagus boseongensis TaxID=1442587 RepID=A0A4R6T1S7_9BACT|nr:outer membrane beta-barrel protein [Algoriphagus boseongensis]TDQ15170.1 outer membrane protein with beta-barrel domain [Algoriphagus boseongensis]
MSQKIWIFLIPRKYLFFSFLWFLVGSALAQTQGKRDYIVLADTIYSQGKIDDIPSEENTVLFFSRSKKEEFKKYTIKEINEFRVSDRLFFRKSFQLNGEDKLAFLEKLPHSTDKVSLWKWNGKINYFFVETPSGIHQLEAEFRPQLLDAYGNLDLDPLISLTRPKELSLIYLAKTAKTIQKPRTFTNLFGITPWVGYSSQTVGFVIPNTNKEGKIQSASPSFGLNAEVFVTFLRNLSFNVGAILSKFDSQDYFMYEQNSIRYESDIFADFNQIQIPVTARYYLDLDPNRWRLFGEVGYGYSMQKYNSMGIYQAKFERNEVETSIAPFSLEDSFSGITWGIGVEKYIRKNQGFSFGLRQLDTKGLNQQSINSLIFYLGYKF